MKRKLKIRQKILLYILTVTAILYVASVGYILWQSRANIYSDAIEKTQLTAKVSAKEVGAIFEKELSLVRTLSQAFTVYKNMPHEQWKKLFLDMYIPVLRENPEIYSIWDSWEYKSFVPGYDKDYGRFVITTWREGNEIKWLYDERSINGDPPIYGKYKKLGQEAIWEPYVDQVTKGKADIKLMITYYSPIYINNVFSGIVASDVSLESLQEMVSKIKPVKGSFAYLISNEGIIAAHPSKDFINKKLVKLETFYDRIIDSDVILSLEQLNTQVKDKVVVIKTNIPGNTLVAKEKSKKFEAAVDMAVDSLKRQIEKIKTKKKEI